MVLLIIGWNVVVFLIYMVDKINSMRGAWRIREDFLLGISVFMGGVGALCALILLNHKTSKPKFIATAVVGVVLVLIVSLNLSNIEALLSK